MLNMLENNIDKIENNIENIENNIENIENNIENIETTIENIEKTKLIDNKEPEIKKGKKRGRKPKKVDTSIPPEIKIPKKRGRKPKIKIVTQEDKNKFVLPSKRGRKPKDKTLPIDKISNINDISNTILHLPIPSSILNNIDNNNMNVINPYDPDILENNVDHNIDSLNTLNNENSCKYSEIDNFKIKKQDSNNNFQDSFQDSFQNNFQNNFHDSFHNSNIQNTNLNNNELQNEDLNISPLNNTNYVKMYSNREQSYVKCNWCLHDCEKNNIFKLPYEINNEEIKYFGNFCCPECAVAFNFNELDDEYIWERYSLLNYLYSDGNNKLNIAPSRLILDIFGGPISINEYKNIIQTKKHVNIIMPPHLLICPQLEVKRSKENNIFIPLNINRINKYTDDLKLKREKPVNNMNTLEDCMNLKCI